MRSDARMIPGLTAALAMLLLSPALGAAAVSIRLEGPDRIRQYERIEFHLDVNEPLANPFDPEETDLTLEVHTPSGKTLLVPAFWMQPYERVDRDPAGSDPWMYPSGLASFRARFAPMELGRHSCCAVLRGRGVTGRSDPVSFECTAGPGRGFVRVSRRDSRFLEFADGTPFFPVGQNLAFIGYGQYLNLRRLDQVLSKLAANGANYARIWTCCEDWAVAIEARKSAWSRSWAWNPPFAPMPDSAPGSKRQCVRIDLSRTPRVTVDPPHRVALRAGTKYALTVRARTEANASLGIELGGQALGQPVRSPDRWADFRGEFTTGANQWWLPPLTLRATGTGAVSIESISLREAAGGPELLREADPNLPVRGLYHQLDCFMIDEVLRLAERHGIWLQLCLVTRDLYMKSLEKEGSDDYRLAVRDIKNLLRYAVARWGCFDRIAAWEYFNEMNPGLPMHQAYLEWGSYLEQIDPWQHLRATSAWGPSPADWAHPKLDTADLHWYLRPAWGELSRDAAAAVLDRARLLRSHASSKPALLSEFGLADDRWGQSSFMAEDKEGLHVHNALWASALSGLSGTAMFWWWERLDAMDAYRHYRPVAEFVSGIPFNAGRLQAAKVGLSGKSCRVIGLQGADCAWLWVQDLDSTWHKAVVEKKSPSLLQNQAVTIADLDPGRYELRWYHTWQGKWLNEEQIRVDRATLRLSVPPFTRDVACRLVRLPATKKD